mgnify:CR=1 FL=1
MKLFCILGFRFWTRRFTKINRVDFGISRFLSDNPKSKIQNLKWAVATGLVVAAAAHGADSQKWQQDWERTVAAGKKEGQLSIYISGYEEVLPDFQKEYPEIKVAPITGRGSRSRRPITLSTTPAATNRGVSSIRKRRNSCINAATSGNGRRQLSAEKA